MLYIYIYKIIINKDFHYYHYQNEYILKSKWLFRIENEY